MARSEQKLKMLALLDILKEYSDEEQLVTMEQIILLLSQKGIAAERKSIYDDIDCLRNYGCNIVNKRGKNGGYYLADREFSLSELKLLVDAVQASKFITHKKSEELIKKLEGLTSKNKAVQLRRSVVMYDRVKNMNESSVLTVDAIQDAINRNSKISFKYFNHNIKKEKVLRNNGESYTVSPWALIWDSENYYMVAFDDKDRIMKNYRVDKMLYITLLNKKRDGAEQNKRFDPGKYSRKMFGMYGGDTVNVKLRCDKSLIDVMLDRFGIKTILTPSGDLFDITVEVAKSPVFLSWIMQFGSKVTVLEPKEVKDDLLALAKTVAENYST